ncbi:hypothetical protein AMTRI_Chr12g235850 [Amborella trichopoda]|uniref:Uncharacterized protein n=1 Tax=Amborella trichopoda TaxID=13333 RepID=W1NMK6_AMBTC|nr:hypothetical protein AMTR_s00001p00273010 [Amborella trichopoda]
MTLQPMNLWADIGTKCFQYDGVLHIKEALRKAEVTGNNDCPMKIKLATPPLHRLTIQTLDNDAEGRKDPSGIQTGFH